MEIDNSVRSVSGAASFRTRLLSDSSCLEVSLFAVASDMAVGLMEEKTGSSEIINEQTRS